MQLHESAEDYLEAILMLHEEKGYARSVDISLKLGVTKPSVSVAVGKLIEAGLITMNDDKTIRFTEHGRALAELTLAKHQFLKDLLRNAGVDDETAEKEACAMEHAISEDSFRKLEKTYSVT